MLDNSTLDIDWIAENDTKIIALVHARHG